MLTVGWWAARRVGWPCNDWDDWSCVDGKLGQLDQCGWTTAGPFSGKLPASATLNALHVLIRIRFRLPSQHLLRGHRKVHSLRCPKRGVVTGRTLDLLLALFELSLRGLIGRRGQSNIK